MRSIFGILLAVVMVGSANAEIVPCRNSPTGYCNVMPAPRPVPGVGIGVRTPNVGVSVMLPTVGAPGYAPRPYGQAVVEEGVVEEGATVQAGAVARGKPRCSNGARFVAEINKCLYTETNASAIQQVSPDVAIDPECQGKPSGYRFTRPVTGPHGEIGTAHQVCGSRPGS